MHALIFDGIDFLLKANVEFAAFLIQPYFLLCLPPNRDAPLYPTSLWTPVFVVTFRHIIQVDLKT